MTTFTLDPRLDADTIPILIEGTLSLRLVDDARWPWLMVVPMVADLADADNVPESLRPALGRMLYRASALLKALELCDSTNVATLSNVVTQLHWHVVGRRAGDPGWPGPVWGHGQKVPYAEDEAAALVARIRDAWDKGTSDQTS